MLEALIERVMQIHPPILPLKFRVKVEEIVNKIISLIKKVVQKGVKIWNQYS